MINKIGIIEKLLTGEYQSPFSRKNIKLPIEEIVITPSVINYQFRHFEKFENKRNLIVSGAKSFASLGDKITTKFGQDKIKYEIKILENYQSTVEYASLLASSLKEYENIICIGSGSVVDICKFIWPSINFKSFEDISRMGNFWFKILDREIDVLIGWLLRLKPIPV